MSDTNSSWTFKKYATPEKDIELMEKHGIKPVRRLNNDGAAPVFDDKGTICWVASRIERTRKTPYDAPDDERDAHAALIATAKDLRSSLEDLLQILREQSKEYKAPPGFLKRLESHMQRADLVLTKSYTVS